MKKHLMLLLAVVVLSPAISSGYPNGTPMYVTDNAPFCASCHSSAKAEYSPELPKEATQMEAAEGRHYGLVRMQAPPSPYMELTGEQRERLIKEAELIDSASSVKIEAPLMANKGETVTVKIAAKGGNGPAIGVMLVDRPLRYQARPISSGGWQIASEPVVKAQDGSIQKAWLEKRLQGIGRNLNFILVTDQIYDMGNKLFPSAEIIFKVKAPSEPGVYSMTAAFLYGTENAGTAGFFQRPSGRILFSEEVKIRVE